MPLFVVLSLSLIFSVLPRDCMAQDHFLPRKCTYQVQTWNVHEKRSVLASKVEHPYSELSPEEIDPETGCSVCSEDQDLISIPQLPSFSICYKLAPRVRAVLKDLAGKGAPIGTIIGYHVIKSRGVVDNKGNRTGFSNHSFGTAIDINPEQNGLYDNCISFGRDCRLSRGGEWRPGAPGALDKNNDIVTLFKQARFQWGGEIAGKQKDFMHFSLTGY